MATGEPDMKSRNLGRALVVLGIIAIVLSMGWWAWYYNLVIQGLGPKPTFTHPMRCLLWTADVCTQAQATAVKAAKGAPQIPAYNPLALLGSILVLLAGLFVVWRSTSTQPYPVTPPGEPTLFVPKLEPFYAWTRDLSWLVVRVAAGGTLLTVGIDKVLNRDINVFATGSLARRGIEPAMPLAYFTYFVESVGALMIVLGLFTRFFGAALAIQFFIITFIAQFSTSVLPARGWGIFLMWGLLFFAIALRGGGPYSLDRRIGKEL
jgi:putative oxidoreductase